MPPDETIRPSRIGYSVGCRRATSSPSTSKSGKSKPATQRTVSSAASRARSRLGTSARSSDRAGAPQEPLEEPGWLVDAEMHLLDRPAAYLDGHAPLTFDPGEGIDRERARRRPGPGHRALSPVPATPVWNPGEAALNVLSTRVISAP